VAVFAKYPPLSRFIKNLQITQTEDVKKYIDLVVKGQLYEYLSEEFKRRGLKYTTRDEVKEQVLIILFDKNVDYPQSRRVFEELFPEVHRIFSLVRGYERGHKFKSYQRFAILLQRIEAHIILNIILKRINKEHAEYCCDNT
jgi:hypothetical protein